MINFLKNKKKKMSNKQIIASISILAGILGVVAYKFISSKKKRIDLKELKILEEKLQQMMQQKEIMKMKDEVKKINEYDW